MRTDERTYKEKLAIGDPDRKSNLHNNTCLYLAQPDKIRKMLALVRPTVENRDDLRGVWSFTEVGCARLSHPLQYRGYQTTPRILGYADLLLKYASTNQDLCVVVEVKSRTTHVTEIIQQIGTYKQALFFGPSAFVCATCYPISDLEKETLANNGVHHIYVSPESVSEFMLNQSMPDKNIEF